MFVLLQVCSSYCAGVASCSHGLQRRNDSVRQPIARLPDCKMAGQGIEMSTGPPSTRHLPPHCPVIDRALWLQCGLQASSCIATGGGQSHMQHAAHDMYGRTGPYTITGPYTRAQGPILGHTHDELVGVDGAVVVGVEQAPHAVHHAADLLHAVEVLPHAERLRRRRAGRSSQSRGCVDICSVRCRSLDRLVSLTKRNGQLTGSTQTHCPTVSHLRVQVPGERAAGSGARASSLTLISARTTSPFSSVPLRSSSKWLNHCCLFCLMSGICA